MIHFDEYFERPFIPREDNEQLERPPKKGGELKNPPFEDIPNDLFFDDFHPFDPIPDEKDLENNKQTFVKTSTSKITKIGYVLDENKNPLVGAHIIDKSDNTNGTFTNDRGYFEFTTLKASKVAISFIGFEDRSITFKNLPREIVLKEASYVLDEVELGTPKKKNQRSYLVIILALIVFLSLKK